MNHRSEESAEEKMNRSDKCKTECIFRDVVLEKCIFETCVREELPPLQLKTVTMTCPLCGDTFSRASLTILTGHGVCGSCLEKLKTWIDRCNDVIRHIDS